MKADLPLLDLSSKAGLDSVLGIGIALIALALLLMCIMAIILIRMRKRTGKRRGKKGCVPSLHPAHIMLLTCVQSCTSTTAQSLTVVTPEVLACVIRKLLLCAVLMSGES